MVIIANKKKSGPTIQIPSETPPPTASPLEELNAKIQQLTSDFKSQPVTPESTRQFEKALDDAHQTCNRQIKEQTFQPLESQKKSDLPQKIRIGRTTYRINKRTPTTIATTSGPIVIRSYYYLNENEGEPGVHPLLTRLGVGAGSATPEMMQRISWQAVDFTQSEVRAWLVKNFGLKWSSDRLRKALRDHRDALLPYVSELQKERILSWLKQAEQSQGKHRPVLAVGRDGIMIPMWKEKKDQSPKEAKPLGAAKKEKKATKKEAQEDISEEAHWKRLGYKEASVATVSVYDRRGKRLGTIYLGQMPEPYQKALTAELTHLIREVLKAYEGPLPRLVYVTDKGSAQSDYFKKALKRMKHPLTKKKLEWEWVLDFWHVCQYVGKLAEGLFGKDSAEGKQWYRKMRKWLKERPQGISHVLRSASQLLGRRKMTKGEATEYWKAYRFLRKHRRHMNYAEYRRRGLPIGSGVTEAACKTVYTQRFKRSGMRWKVESGQVILDLRVMKLSGIWEEVVGRELAGREMPVEKKEGKRGSNQGNKNKTSKKAA